MPQSPDHARGTTSKVTVAVARRADRDDIVRALAAAFATDPQMLWMFDGLDHRERRLERFFRTSFAEHRRQGRIDVARSGGEIVGAAMWKPPTLTYPGIWRQLLPLPGYLAAFGSRMQVAGRMQQAIVTAHPQAPHWYLSEIGVDPAHQGIGAASALMRAGLDRADLARMPAYLESSKPANVPIYEHFGFAVRGTIELPPGAPVLTPMWRSAR